MQLLAVDAFDERLFSRFLVQNDIELLVTTIEHIIHCSVPKPVRMHSFLVVFIRNDGLLNNKQAVYYEYVNF